MINNITGLPSINPYMYGTNQSEKNTSTAVSSDKSNSGYNEYLGDLLEYFKSYGLNIDSSTSKIMGDSLNFNLSFETTNKEEIKTNGSLSFSEKKVSMDLVFNFKKEIVQKVGEELQTFQAKFSFKSDFSKQISIQQSTKKEDITEFVKKITDDIFKILADKGKYLVGVYFKQEDLKDIMQLDNGKFYKVLNQIISLAINLAKLRQVTNSEKAEDVILKPERSEWNVLDTESNINSNTEITAEISQIADE